MPVYEYACEDCGAVTEALRKMAEADAPLACERCGSERTRRAHSVFTAGGSSPSSGDVPLPIGGCGRCGNPYGSCSLED
ncbi:MAG TPA: zinc ribbon domain-containing protein [Phycisphaeraceae bacterium]